jgi:hypothetical protein
MAQVTITVFRMDGPAWQTFVNPSTWNFSAGVLTVTQPSAGNTPASTVTTTLPFIAEQINTTQDQ